MSIASDEVPIFRSEWANRLIDTADVKRLPTNTDRGAINPTTFQYDAEALTTLYTDRPCLIRPVSAGTAPTPSQFGQQETVYTDYAAFFAHDTTGLRVEDRIIPKTVTYDAELVGVVLRVTAVTFDSYKTRLMCICTLDLGAGEQG